MKFSTQKPLFLLSFLDVVYINNQLHNCGAVILRLAFLAVNPKSIHYPQFENQKAAPAQLYHRDDAEIHPENNEVHQKIGVF